MGHAADNNRGTNVRCTSTMAHKLQIKRINRKLTTAEIAKYRDDGFLVYYVTSGRGRYGTAITHHSVLMTDVDGAVIAEELMSKF